MYVCQRVWVLEMCLDESSSSDEEFPIPKVDAFQRIMESQAKKKQKAEVDPDILAAVYIRTLVGVPESHPLYRIVYIGQVVRVGFLNANLMCEKRWQAEDLQAVREEKDMGLIHCIDALGPAAFESKVLECSAGVRALMFRSGLTSAKLRSLPSTAASFSDPSTKCRQTLNLTKGGQGNVNFATRDAARQLVGLNSAMSSRRTLHGARRP